jgi:hypothetical protein
MKSCSVKTKAGKPCRAAAGLGGLCFFHANPDRAKSLGQIGGLKNKKFTGVNLEVPDSITGGDLCRLEVQVVRGLLSGEIPAREATAVAQMLNLLHRHLPTADLERRIALLEEVSARVSMPIDVNERMSRKTMCKTPRSHGYALLIRAQREHPTSEMITRMRTRNCENLSRTITAWIE